MRSLVKIQFASIEKTQLNKCSPLCDILDQFRHERFFLLDFRFRSRTYSTTQRKHYMEVSRSLPLTVGQNLVSQAPNFPRTTAL